MKKFTKLALLAVAVLGIAGVVGGLSLTAQEEAIVIGSINPVTGTNAVQGTDLLRGEQLALEQINEGGHIERLRPEWRDLSYLVGPGICGRPLKIIWEDTESRPAAGIDAVHKLVEVDKVPLILGEYASSVSLPTGEYTNEHGIIQIAECSTSPALREVGPYFFDVMGLDDVLAPMLAEFAMADCKCTRFASITVNNPFGIGIEIHACKRVEELGGECIEKVRYDEGTTDFRALLERLFAKNPEAIFYTAYGTESRLILKQAYEMGLKPPKGWYADYMTMWAKEVIPETAEGIKGWVIGAEPAEDYVEAYRARFGEDPLTAFGGYGYDATWIAAIAMNLACLHYPENPADPEVLKRTLFTAGAIYNGVTGDKTFDADGMQLREQVRWMIYTKGKLEPYPYPGG